MKAEPLLLYLEEKFSRHTQELIDYSKIPSVSFEGFPEGPLLLSAEWTANKMKQVGLENVEMITLPGCHPYVYGEWMKAPGKPTLLLYGHHDVQPPGRSDHWKSPAFEPSLREGRLYGRGVADDKAGVLMHLNALEAYLKTEGSLPLNVRFIVEGEEETGSEHLGEFLHHYRDKLKSDVMVLTDTGNLEEGLPSITYRLRGLIDATVEVRTLDHPIHSGMWGGPVMDALTTLSQLLSRLVTSEGKIAIPGFYEDVEPVEGHEKGLLESLPFHEDQFRKDVGSIPSLKLAGDSKHSVYEKMWCQPALAILGIDAPSVQETSNKIVEWARAKISIRIVSRQDPHKCLQKLSDFLKKDPPFGATVHVTPGVANPAWKIDPNGKAFEMAARALEKGFGKPAAFVGCGGSIPFVKPITEVFGGIPALLIGIEDPACNAHGENESLSLSDWKKGMKSAIFLYEELGKLS